MKVWHAAGCWMKPQETKSAPAEIIGRIWRLTFTSRVNVHRGLLRRAAEQKKHVGGEKRHLLGPHARATKRPPFQRETGT